MSKVTLQDDYLDRFLVAIGGQAEWNKIRKAARELETATGTRPHELLFPESKATAFRHAGFYPRPWSTNGRGTWVWGSIDGYTITTPRTL